MPSADTGSAGPDESPNKLSDIRAELEAWYDAAIELLADNPQSHVQIMPAHESEWFEIGSGVYGQRPAVRKFFSGETMNSLRQLSAYAALENASMNSRAIGPLFDSQVGSYLMTHPFDFWDFAVAAIPTLDELAEGAIRSFEEIYADLEKQRSDFSNYSTLCYLHGIGFAEPRIELEENLTIERLASGEIIAALKHGIISSPFGPAQSTFWMNEYTTFALKKNWRQLRRWGGEPIPGVGKTVDEMNDISEESGRLVQCLGLLVREPVSITGVLTRQMERSFIFPYGGDAEVFSIWPAPRQFQGVSLDSDECGDLQKLWKISKNTGSAQLKAFGLALRRLGYGLQRTRLEDRLLDVCIAAEAFYLTEKGGDDRDRGEMTYRLSQRVAAWSEGTMPGWSRLEVFKQIRSGYTVRNTVAHGGSPRQKDLKIKGSQIPITEFGQFIQCIEEIVRAGLRKAFREATAENPLMEIDWDELIFRDSQNSSPTETR
jgi:hypothetical protein